MISVLYMIVILVYENELSNATLKHHFIEMCQFYACLLNQIHQGKNHMKLINTGISCLLRLNIPKLHLPLC